MRSTSQGPRTPEHEFDARTLRCARCNLHRFHVVAVPDCSGTSSRVPLEGPPARRVVLDGVVVHGPEA